MILSNYSVVICLLIHYNCWSSFIVDQAQKTSLLLEMNLRFLSANLQLNSLLLNSLGNSKALDESNSIIRNILSWLRTLTQYSDLDSTKILVDALIDAVDRSNKYNLTINPQNIQPLMDSNVSRVSNSTGTQKNDGSIIPNHSTNKRNPVTNIDDLVNVDHPFQENQPTEAKSFFNRDSELKDQWDYVSTIKSFISSYINLMHVLIPNLAFEVAIELNRYNCDNKLLLHDSITHPTLAFQNLITKLLREAPGSNLFRRIRRHRLDRGIDIDADQRVNASESDKIRNLVVSYFETLGKYLDPANTAQENLDALFEKTRGNYRQFSLGPLSVEARLTAVVKNVTETAFNEATDVFSNEAASKSTKVVYLATTQLLCDFQNFLLQETRSRNFLEELKS